METWSFERKQICKLLSVCLLLAETSPGNLSSAHWVKDENHISETGEEEDGIEAPCGLGSVSPYTHIHSLGPKSSNKGTEHTTLRSPGTSEDMNVVYFTSLHFSKIGTIIPAVGAGKSKIHKA